MSERWRRLFAIAVAVIALDQGSKFLAVKNLTPGLAEVREGTLLEQIGRFYGEVEHPCRAPGAACRPIDVVADFWAWRYVQNPGAAWGFLAGANESVRVPFFFVVSLAAIAFILNYVRRIADEQRRVSIALSLVLGGAIGNFIDRLHLSYVIDFIDWYVLLAGQSHHWPTFNVADAAISIGVGLLLLDMLLAKKQAEAVPPASSSAY